MWAAWCRAASSGTATEIYQEGVRIPPIKLVERGTINKAAMDLILSNMRVPDERLGDFHAGMAACHTAERRIHELVARYGLDTLLECVRINLARSEARMREQIAADSRRRILLRGLSRDLR